MRFFAEIGNFWAFAMSDKLAMLGPRGRAKVPAKVPWGRLTAGICARVFVAGPSGKSRKSRKVRLPVGRLAVDRRCGVIFPFIGLWGDSP